MGSEMCIRDRSSLVMLLGPIFTLGTAYVLLDDWPTRGQLTGGAIMLVGIALPLWRRRR